MMEHPRIDRDVAVKDPYGHLDGQDAYYLLGIPDDASPEMIRQAFKERIKRWHPDQHRGRRRAKAERQTRYLTAARDILINHRTDYDGRRPAPTRGRRLGWFLRRHSPTRRRAALVVIGIWVLGLAGCAITLQLTADGVVEPSAKVPRGFAGTWTGDVVLDEALGERFKIRLTLREGKRIGTIIYPNSETFLSGECSGTLIPLSMRRGRLKLLEDSNGGYGCEDSEVYVSRIGERALLLDYVLTGEKASAELRRE